MNNFSANAKTKADQKYSNELCHKKLLAIFCFACGELCGVFEEMSSSNQRYKQHVCVSSMVLLLVASRSGTSMMGEVLHISF